MNYKQYQVVIVNLDPTVGSEIKKTRPCVILSPDELHNNLKTVTIAPLTSTSKAYPTRIKINFQNKDGWVVLDQIRTIDKVRIVRASGKITASEILQIKQILKETFVD